jgi:hypothetical protein
MPEQQEIIILKHEDQVEVRKLIAKARQFQIKAQIAGMEVESYQMDLAKKYGVVDKKHQFNLQNCTITVTSDEDDSNKPISALETLRR